MSTTYGDLTFTTFPDTKQVFMTMLDIDASDAAKVSSFQNAMQQGDIAGAQAIFATISNANQKFVNASVLNTLMQTCQALQRFYQDNISGTITTKQAEWYAVVNKMGYKGVFSPSTQYETNNYVAYSVGGVTYIYIAISQPPIGTYPTNETYWRQVSVRGEKGESGTGLTFRYEWSSATSYSVNDLVTYNNALWNCIATNTNQPPAIGSSYWSLLANMNQITYPFQSNQPSGQSTGELWIKVL